MATGPLGCMGAIEQRGTRTMWRRLCRWQARVCATAAWTLDGSRQAKPATKQVAGSAHATGAAAAGGARAVVTRVAINQDGLTVGGELAEEDRTGDNYLAELAAQLDALEEAAEGERIIIIFDASSPVHALCRFMRSQGRARQGVLAAEWLQTFEALLSKCTAAVLLWQTSHVGEPCNEWADVEADMMAQLARSGDEVRPVPRAAVSFASMLFPDYCFNQAPSHGGLESSTRNRRGRPTGSQADSGARAQPGWVGTKSWSGGWGHAG